MNPFKRRYRTPRNYKGTRLTSKSIRELLPSVLRSIGENYQERPDLILAAWPKIIGESLAPMTEAVGFEDGLLLVRVKNSTLYQLLREVEKPRILKSLRAKFPKIEILNVIFRIR